MSVESVRDWRVHLTAIQIGVNARCVCGDYFVWEGGVVRVVMVRAWDFARAVAERQAAADRGQSESQLSVRERESAARLDWRTDASYAVCWA